MKLISSRLSIAGAMLAAICAGNVDAAQTGGSVSLSGGSGGPDPGCSIARLVPTTTVQDSFALAATTSCNGGVGSAQVQANALVPSIGLAGTATNSSAAAFVILSDLWTIGVAPGIPVGGTFSLPVSFRLDGDVVPGSVFGRAGNSFLNVAGALGQFGTASGVFQFSSRVDKVGHFDQTFSGLATFTNHGPGVPTLGSFEISLSMPFLTGAVDFYNTLSATVEVPPGFTVTTSSGAALFAVSTVPEPDVVWLLLGGMGVLVARSARRTV